MCRSPTAARRTACLLVSSAIGRIGATSMPTTPTSDHDADDLSQAFYVRVMTRLQEARVPFLVGGAFALARFTGIERNTKDFDIFVRREDIDRALKALADDGCM